MGLKHTSHKSTDVEKVEEDQEEGEQPQRHVLIGEDVSQGVLKDAYFAVFSHCGKVELCRLAQVCSLWKEISERFSGEFVY
jgi:hypothetical protein